MQDNNIIQNAIDCIKLLKYEIKELKIENEKLRALCDMYKTFYKAKHNDIDGKLFKYRQTLQEIKEVAEMDVCSNCITQKREYNCQCLADTILQLITKAEKAYHFKEDEINE